MTEAILAGLAVFGIGLGVLVLVAAAIAAGDRLACRRWASDEREVEGLRPTSRSSGASVGSRASSLCEGCGQPHSPEVLPVELLIAGGVQVSLGDWFGRRG